VKLIKKIKMKNFKKFKNSEIYFNDNFNMLIGDNESGKSSILQAIDLIISGSRSNIENIGLESLFNTEIIKEFMSKEKNYKNLPELYVEIYLNEQENFKLNGNYNSEDTICDGLRFECLPNDDYSDEILELLSDDDTCFPFEYYSISFKTFGGDPYNGYNKYLRKIFIDNSSINDEYATSMYIKDVYAKNVSPKQKAKHQSEYRKYKSAYVNKIFKTLNGSLEDYSFDLKTDRRSNLENDLSIKQGEIFINNMGQGKKSLIKTEFALSKSNPENDIDTLLLEEPENHLSHINMNKLINIILQVESKQIFIATHNNMISRRLDLRNVIMLNSSSEKSISLKSIPDDTAKFFMKSSDNNILDYILSKKVILVEGDAEYILMESFYNRVTGNKLCENDIHIISVGGISFKRYLDIGRVIGIKTAVIRDNDKDYKKNCIDLYTEYIDDNIKIFYDDNNRNYTFEINVYKANKDICDELFSPRRKTLTVQEYMLKNKSEVAFQMLDKKSNKLKVPNHIREAIEWIND